VRKRLQRVIEKEKREARLISEYAEHRVKRYYNPVEECEIEEEFRMLEDLKNSLPEEIRLIFFDWVNGKTYKEIGEEKGITKQAIQLRCEKGVWLMRKAYRKRLGKLVGKIDGKT
jgi:DNA-directed RNA polymerase specialized sigma24 family protein